LHWQQIAKLDDDNPCFMFSFTGFLNTIILLGVLQGIITCILLFSLKKAKTAGRLLAMLILLMTLASLNLYLNETGFTSLNGLTSTLDAVLPMVMVMPMGPLIYFFIRSSLDPNFRMTKQRRLHFIPVLIDLVPSFTVIVFFTGVYTGLIAPKPGPWGMFIDDYNVYADIPRWFSVTAYLYLTARHLNKLKKVNVLKNGMLQRYRWLRHFVLIFLAFQLIWLFYLVPYVIPKYTDWMLDTFKWYPVYVPLAVMIYWLGIKGFLMLQHPVDSRKNAATAVTLATDSVKTTISLLKSAMEVEKVYLNPELNLALLSAHTGIAQKTISNVLNQHLQKSFNEFLNEYRVEAFKSKLRDENTNRLTIAGVAMECGFNSQATFQRTFKEMTGMSPSEFRKNRL
jgi:AraC-like DNA-binding protein